MEVADPTPAVKRSPRVDWTVAGKKFLKGHPEFRRVMALHPRVPLKRAARVDLFSSLAHAIVNQQLSGRVADILFARLQGLFPRKRLDPKRLLRMKDARLRKIGLSWNKVRFLKDLARHLVQGRLPTVRELGALSDEILMEKLTAVHGIGPWTVQMLLIFKLGRPDVFPHADLGVQKGFQRLYGLAERPSAKHILEFSHRWKPYRTLAAWYLWRVSDDAQFNPTETAAVLWEKS